MSRLRRVAAVMLVVLFGANAQAGDPSRSLDSVDKGESQSLDSVDTGESESPDDLQAQSESLDDAEASSPPADAAASAPAALPDIEDPTALAQARDAREAVLVAQQRVTQANAAYSNMMARDYPQGDARAAIVMERDAARQGYEQANGAYSAILNQN